MWIVGGIGILSYIVDGLKKAPLAGLHGYAAATSLKQAAPSDLLIKHCGARNLRSGLLHGLLASAPRAAAAR